MTVQTMLEDQIRECFGRVVYTHKTHEKMADLCAAALRRCKLGQIALSALTTCGALSLLLIDPLWLKILTALLSFATLWVSGYMKGFDPGGTAQKHRDAASTLWDIRESYLSLLTDLKRGAISEDVAAERRDDFQAQLAKIYKGAPQTTAKAYGEAQQALQKLEDYTFSDAEIDAFLPESLKKSGAR